MGRKKKIPRELVAAKILRLSHEGRGIAEVNGKTTFIRNALPDETVKFKYLKCHRQYDEGLAVEIIQASKDRITAKCQHYNTCGGCSLQHISSEKQIQNKQAVLLEQFEHFAAGQPKNILPPLTGPEWNYRYKARLGVKHVYKKEKVLVGFREIDGRFIADLQGCEVLHPLIAKLIPELSSLIIGLTVSAQIPQIEVACGDENCALIFRHLQPMADSDVKSLCEFGQSHAIDIYLQPGDYQSIHKIYPENTPELLSYKVAEYDLEYLFHPTDFTQINPEINRKMLHLALELIDLNPHDVVLDLFCGLGNFSLALAKHCAKVIGVEGDQAMVKRATENAAHNGLNNCEFYCADLTQDISNQAWAKQQFNKILIDPPRSGAFEVLDTIIGLNPKTILYISCNPATLARDAGKLQEHGYVLEQAGVMDMFPHTQHVESIALFFKD